MKKKGRLLFIILFLTLSFWGYGQNRIEFPLVSNNFSPNLLIFQPAAIKFSSNSKSVFAASYDGRTGIQKNIKNSYIRFETRKNNKRGHHFGATFLRYQSSSFISRNRFHLNYKYRLPLDTVNSIVLGTTIGLYNFFIGDNPSNVSGSSTVPDANIGFSFYGKSIQAGFSINQFLNNDIRPLENSYLLERYFSFFASYKKYIGLSSSVEFHSLYNALSTQSDLSIETTYTYKKKFGIGLSYRNFRGLALLLKVNNIQLQKSLLDIHLSSSVISNNSLGLQYQINLFYHLGYLLDKNK